MSTVYIHKTDTPLNCQQSNRHYHDMSSLEQCLETSDKCQIGFEEHFMCFILCVGFVFILCISGGVV